MERLLQLYRKYPGPRPAAQVLPLAALQAVRAAPALLETKHRIGKKSQTFNLENWLHSPDLAVGRWVAVESKDYASPVGAYSWGVWWKNKNIGAYRIHDPHGNLMAYRLDVLKDVVISSHEEECSLTFSDLVVDMWMWPDHENSAGSSLEMIVEDLDELDTLRDNKIISVEDCLKINDEINAVLSAPEAVAHAIDSAIEKAVSSWIDHGTV